MAPTSPAGSSRLSASRTRISVSVNPRPRVPGCSSHSSPRQMTSPGHAAGRLIDDGDGRFGAGPGRGPGLLSQLLGRLLLEHVEEVVVTDLEHPGSCSHA